AIHPRNLLPALLACAPRLDVMCRPLAASSTEPMSRDDAADGSGDAEGQMPFAVRSARSDDVTRVEVTGESDLDTAPRMREVLDAALETGDPVVIDMHGVTFMDSTGFGVLVLVNLRAMRPGTPVALRG